MQPLSVNAKDTELPKQQETYCTTKNIYTTTNVITAHKYSPGILGPVWGVI